MFEGSAVWERTIKLNKASATILARDAMSILTAGHEDFLLESSCTISSTLITTSCDHSCLAFYLHPDIPSAGPRLQEDSFLCSTWFPFSLGEGKQHEPVSTLNPET